MSVFLLEVHPSLCLASAVYRKLAEAHAELCQLHRASRATHKLLLRRKLLQQALHGWNSLPSPGASYSCQIQKDVGLKRAFKSVYIKYKEVSPLFVFARCQLFSGLFFEDPILVQKVGMSFIRSAEKTETMQGRETQSYVVETFTKLLELVTIRHRVLESASETAHLAQLRKPEMYDVSFVQ